MLLRSKQIHVPLGKIIKINFVGRFVGRFFPSSIAPDAIKAYSLAKYIDNASEAMSSIFIERYIGLFSLLTLALFGVIASFRQYQNYNILWIILALLSLFFAFWFLVFNRAMAMKIADRFHFLRRNSWSRKIGDFYRSLLIYKTNDALLFKVLMLSFIIQTVRILMIYVGAVALDLNISLGYFFMFIPVIIIISMIPTTIASIGVAEGAYVYFFSRVGAPPHGAFALSILVRILYTFLTLPGGIFYIREGISPKKEVTS
jgi:uncharacterized protein (TIRG00374 family)